MSDNKLTGLWYIFSQTLPYMDIAENKDNSSYPLPDTTRTSVERKEIKTARNT